MKAWLAGLEAVCVAVFVAAVAQADAIEAARRSAVSRQGGSFTGGGMVVHVYWNGCLGPTRSERRDRER